MKTFIITIGICLLSLITMSAKEDQKTTLDLLRSTVWKRENRYTEEGHADGCFYKFDRKKATFFEMKRGKVVNEEYRTPRSFYISNTIDEEYDKKKERRLKSGKYIVFAEVKVDIEASDPTGEKLRKALQDEINGVSHSASDIRKSKKELKKYSTIVPFVYEIVSLTEDELILERILPEIMIGSGKITRYTPYRGKINR